MTTLTETQLRDALAYIEVLNTLYKKLPEEPDWGDGMHLVLPKQVPLSPDFEGDKPVAWLVANDFGGYDLTTTNPETKKETN